MNAPSFLAATMSGLQQTVKSVEKVEQATNLFVGGVQWLIGFDNGYGASIVSNDMSYGVELAVLNGFDGPLCYDTPITDDMLGNLDDPESLLDAIISVGQLPRSAA